MAKNFGVCPQSEPFQFCRGKNGEIIIKFCLNREILLLNCVTNSINV